LRSHCQQLLSNLPKRGPFLLAHGLRVQLERGAVNCWLALAPVDFIPAVP